MAADGSRSASCLAGSYRRVAFFCLASGQCHVGPEILSALDEDQMCNTHKLVDCMCKGMQQAGCSCSGHEQQ